MPQTTLTSSQLRATGVGAAAYHLPDITINAQGQVTAASAGVVALVSDVSGTLSLTHGGTGADLHAAAQGAVPYIDASGAMSTLAAGTANQLMVTGGAGANPAWANIASLLAVTRGLTLSGTTTATLGMPTGTTSYTLRYDGTNWAADAMLQNTGALVAVGNPSGPSLQNGEFQVLGLPTASRVLVATFEASAATAPTYVAVGSAGSSVRFGKEGSASQFYSGLTGGDCGIGTDATGHRLYLGEGGGGASQNLFASFEAAGLGVGLGTNSLLGRIHAAPTSAQVGVYIGLAAAQSGNALNVVGSDGTILFSLSASGQPTMQDVGAASTLSVATDGNKNCLLTLRGATTGVSPQGRAQMFVGPYIYPGNGDIMFAISVSSWQGSGARVNCGNIQFNAAEAQASGKLGTDILLRTCSVGASTLTTRQQFTANGNAVLNGTGSALATSAVDGFAHMPNMAGLPTGAASAYTGASPLVYDTANKAWWLYGTDPGGTSRWMPTQGRRRKTNTGNLTMVTADLACEITASGSNVTVTLPAANAVPPGQLYTILLIGEDTTRTMTVQRAGSDTINNKTSVSTSTLYNGFLLYSDGTNSWQCANWVGS
ncbi:MAG: hypothetical protein HYR64_03790 [Fimbriimonas ginsengisoli]|uniref:Uncharacterized protein n=1 Tax=Fimbriimonas ginsengisoli TaxID=1005039 RepID=A0A931PW27_FIMGI|nr:hypothetical protein [Fimbriimonas ginsengisoli]